MWKSLRYKKYLIAFKIITMMVIILLSLLAIKDWNYGGTGLATLSIFAFNFIVNHKRLIKLDGTNWLWLKVIGNFILINILLFFVNGFNNPTYVLYYCYFIITVNIHFGKRPAIGALITCVLISLGVMGASTHGLGGYLFRLYLYGSSFIIGYFLHMEELKNKELDNKVKEFGALYKISKIIDEFPGTEEMLTNITKIVAETMDVATSVIMFYDEEKDLLMAKYGYGICNEVLGKLVLGPGEGVERQLIDNQERIAVCDTSTNCSCMAFLGESCQMHYVVAVPLVLKNKIIGTLSIYDVKPYNLTKEDRELLYLLSSRIGVVLENDRLYKQLKRNAMLDGLTGLYNHKQFYDKLKSEVEHAKDMESKVFLLMIDIDKFKCFNDRYGHLVGDEVLVEISKTIQNSIRDTDIAARYGGEEFAIILPNATSEAASIVADRIRNNVKSITDRIEGIKDKEIEITVSIGMACYPNCTNDITHLIDMADGRMYKGKKMGGDRVIA